MMRSGSSGSPVGPGSHRELEVVEIDRQLHQLLPSPAVTVKVVYGSRLQAQEVLEIIPVGYLKAVVYTGVSTVKEGTGVEIRTIGDIRQAGTVIERHQIVPCIDGIVDSEAEILKTGLGLEAAWSDVTLVAYPVILESLYPARPQAERHPLWQKLRKVRDEMGIHPHVVHHA